MEHISIKHWSLDERPREKLIEIGSHSLSNSELLAIVLGSGSVNESAVQLSKRMLSSVDNSISEFAKFSIEDFKKFKGIGDAKAVTLSACFELARRKANDVPEFVKIQGANDVFKVLSPYLSDLRHEEFWVLFLNRGNIIIRKEKISSGGISGTVVDKKIILKKALLHLCSSIILVHNHPSGNLIPSVQDKNVTKKIKEACELLEINLLDHVIIAGNAYYSFADELML